MWWCGVVALAVGFGAAPRAVDVGLTPESATQALTFARQASFAEREAFHAAYWRAPGEVVRRISLVTEYRRAVLRIEEQRRQRLPNDDVAKAVDAGRPWRGLIEVVVELQFHPQNRLARVPLYDVLLVPLDGPDPRQPLVPEMTDRNPRFGTFWAPPPAEAPWWPFPPPGASVVTDPQPMTGGYMQARFDSTALRKGHYDVVIKDGAATLGVATFDFSALR